jgi:hypothetical protein
MFVVYRVSQLFNIIDVTLRIKNSILSLELGMDVAVVKTMVNQNLIAWIWATSCFLAEGKNVKRGVSRALHAAFKQCRAHLMVEDDSWDTTQDGVLLRLSCVGLFRSLGKKNQI